AVTVTPLPRGSATAWTAWTVRNSSSAAAPLSRTWTQSTPPSSAAATAAMRASSLPLSAPDPPAVRTRSVIRWKAHRLSGTERPLSSRDPRRAAQKNLEGRRRDGGLPGIPDGRFRGVHAVAVVRRRIRQNRPTTPTGVAAADHSSAGNALPYAGVTQVRFQG